MSSRMNILLLATGLPIAMRASGSSIRSRRVADAAAATAERTEVIGLVESLKKMVDDVDAALLRLAEGSYGTCAECGREIGAERLEFRPESILCVECKAKNH